jgi:hypothetical protein
MRGSLLLIVLFVLASPVARGDPLQHEFLLLPSADVVGTFDRRAPITQVNDAVLKADMIFSLQKGPFKVFGEYLVSDHEADLERFQLGWQMSDDTVIWVGRYHQPTSVWNHDHHHGQYLQTSITRPAIDEWEDLRGVLPQHFTGVLIESSKQVFGTWRSPPSAWSPSTWSIPTTTGTRWGIRPGPRCIRETSVRRVSGCWWRMTN